MCIPIGATGGSGCCSGACGAGSKLGGTWACDGAPSEDIGGTAWACDGAPSEDIGGTAWACDGGTAEDIAGTAWACDGAPSEDIGGTAWARFLLGGTQSVLR